MQTPLLQMPTTLECPRCGKHTIVSYRDGVYTCLNCNFEKDLSTAPADGISLGSLMFGSAGVLVTLLLLL